MKNKQIVFIVSVFSFLLLLTNCSNNHYNESIVKHPDWIYKSVLYEVNIRQYTPEGTFAAFDNHLTRLSSLGVDILWFMPIYPIGVVDRKGELGSYYSVRDYKGINPEYGTIEDFKNTVKKAHDLGFKVIIDWVANHTSKDHKWIEEHPDWYVKDSLGNLVSPFDWSDVAKLNYDNNDMKRAMIEALKFWVVECGIDGYRCDVAEQVPVAFWEEAFSELRSLRKDLFFLAEAENPLYQINAFDAYYGWENHRYMNQLAGGETSISEYVDYLHKQDKRFPPSMIPMNFTSNHDENSWNGTEFERMNGAARTFAALTFALPGIPLIYTGQEVGMDHRLEFFVKDTIKWEDNDNFTEFYSSLIKMRDEHPAMYAPKKGAPMKILSNDNGEKVFSFERVLEDDKFTAIFNFSRQELTVTLKDGYLKGTQYRLAPYGYQFIF